MALAHIQLVGRRTALSSSGRQRGHPSKPSIEVGVVAFGVVTLPPVPFRKPAGSDGALRVREPDNKEVDTIDDIVI